MQNSNSIKLGKTIIDEHSLPYLIAEIGVNHEGSLKKAFELIDLAKIGGADAVKFQTYKAEKIASKSSPSYWDLNKEPTTSQYNLFKKYDSFNEKEYRELSYYCKEINIDFLSTPFDLECVDFLNDLVPFFKISSSDITNRPLLKKIAHKKKPIVLSTGASNEDEIKEAVKFLEDNGSKDIALLHCILNYPTPDKNAHLGMIKGLKELFPNRIIGYSDHTKPDKEMNCLLTSYLLGAKIIEKHFTYDKNLKGNDHYHSMDVEDLKVLNKVISKSHNLIGSKSRREVLPEEEISRKNARRSLVIKNNLKKGENLTEEDLICKRPGTGISPIYLNQIIGKKLSRDLNYDHILNWDDMI